MQGYDISRPRAVYCCEKMGVPVADNLDDIWGGVDVFFSSHVLEHVPSIHAVISLARRKVRRGGLFVSFTPNGSEEYRIRNPRGWKKSWGRVHPNLVSAGFLKAVFEGHPLLLSGTPYELDVLSGWDRSGRVMMNLSGEELLGVACL